VRLQQQFDRIQFVFTAYQLSQQQWKSRRCPELMIGFPRIYLDFLDCTRKPVALSGYRADQVLLIAKNLAKGSDVLVQSVFHNDDVRPHRIEQFFLAHQSAPRFHQQTEQFERSASDRDWVAIAQKLSPGTELETVKTIGNLVCRYRRVLVTMRPIHRRMLRPGLPNRQAQFQKFFRKIQRIFRAQVAQCLITGTKLGSRRKGSLARRAKRSEQDAYE
jgi:hypothetical protein